MSEAPPEKPDTKVVMKGRIPMCGACNRQVQNEDQWRCPYQGCRAWLRSA